jgi:hypothetical protein
MSLLLGDDCDLRAALSAATQQSTTSDRDGLLTSAIIDIRMGPLHTPLLRAVFRSLLSAYYLCAIGPFVAGLARQVEIESGPIRQTVASATLRLMPRSARGTDAEEINRVNAA